MEGNKEKIKPGTHFESFMKDMEKTHPFYIMSALAAIILTLFFLYFLYDLTRGILESSGQSAVTIPRIMFPGCFLLLITGIFIRRIKSRFENDDPGRLMAVFVYVGILSIAFLSIQVIGLKRLVSEPDNPLQSLLIRDIVVLISSHAVSVFILSCYILYKLLFLAVIKNDPVRSLIYFTSAREKLKLDLLKYAWLYEGYLWLFIYVYLLMVL